MISDQFVGLNLPNGTSDVLTKLIGFAVAGFGVLAIKASVRKVEANHVGLRTRRGRLYNNQGRPYGYERSGIHFITPLISDIEMVEIRERNASVLSTVDVYDHQNHRNVQKKIAATVGWTVLDKEIDGQHAAYRAMTKISEKDNSTEETVKRIVGGVICELASVRVMSKEALHLAEIPELVIAQSMSAMTRYGLGLTDVVITMFTDSDPERLGSLISLDELRHPYPKLS